MMGLEKPLILLTNDDGAEASGLRAIKTRLQNWGSVVVVAPYEERSAVSHGLTIHFPLRRITLERDHHALTGTPADCVLFGIRKLLPRLPDLVVSGINHGANLGDDILYSGTVAGAREAALHQIPAIAVSLVGAGANKNFRAAADRGSSLIQQFYRDWASPGSYLNINIPEGKSKGHRFTRQGSKRVVSKIEEKQDPRGRTYYWIGPDESEWLVEAETDYQAVSEGYISVTPLHRDQTDYRTLKEFTR